MTSSVGDSTKEQKARCAGWHGITYSAEDDTAETVQQIRVHNRTGANKHCWTK